MAVQLYERDRDAFASVLGSAIALRLYLFAVSLMVVLVSSINLLLGSSGLTGFFDAAGVASGVASEVEAAVTRSTGRDLGILLTGLFFAVSAGRSLAKVLAACSAGASRLVGRATKASLRVAVRVTLLTAVLFVAAAVLTRLRTTFGPAVAAGSLAANIVLLSVGWFFVCLSLPRSTRDPGAALPGAVVFGVALTALQWFMHLYLPHKIASASEVMGTLGVAFASLGYLFLIGRLMAATLILNAVLWDEVGSVSGVVFRLPIVRRLPDRFPRLVDFFDLAGDAHRPPMP